MRALVSAVLLLAAGNAAAADSIYSATGQDLAPRERAEVLLDGYLRIRGEALGNLDLDRGLTPSGTPLFPVSAGDPSAQVLTHADTRLRLDLAVYAPGGGVAVKARADLFDNLSLGSGTQGFPATSSSLDPPANALRLKRVWGEALTPVGLFAAGRMGNQWGLGMLANGGDCADCDSGDAADRIAFVTPLAGHFWALAYDLSSAGSSTVRRAGTRAVDLEPTDDVRSFTFAVLRWKDDLSRERRRGAGKTTLEYGAYVSHRTQQDDIPGEYLPAAEGAEDGAILERGFQATAVDGWLRLTFPRVRIEAEAALMVARLEQASLLPGALLRDPVSSTQFGAAVESDIGAPDDPVAAGLDFGFASGDPAPGFGAFPGLNDRQPLPGDLDGAQSSPGTDNRVDNFRFHPDFRVDRILFREIIGTVTDALYVRPHFRWTVGRAGPGVLTAHLAGIVSWAAYASSTPGGQRPLAIEIDPTVSYETRDGFQASLEHALLIPLAGLDNPTDGFEARSAQLLRLRAAYIF